MSRRHLELLLGLVLPALPASAQSQVWFRQLGTGANSLKAAAADGAGGVYVAGDHGGDASLARYDDAGNQLWILQLGTAGDDSIEAAAPDGAGGVYVGGSTTGALGGPGAGGEDAWVARYDGAGAQLWIRQLGTPQDEAVLALALDAGDGLHAGGRTTGALGGSSAGGVDAWLAQYDGAGNQGWILQVGTSGDDELLAAAPDAGGGTFVGGHMGDESWAARYDDLGGLIWNDLFFASDHGSEVGSLAPDGQGGVYAAASRGLFEWVEGPAFGIESRLSRYDASGSELWATSCIGSDLTVEDGAGGVYVGGLDVPLGAFAGRHGLSHRAPDGSVIWEELIDSSWWLRAGAPDAVGWVYAGGFLEESDDSDAWLARYRDDGASYYCFGGTLCPCGNGAEGHGAGCLNSSGGGEPEAGGRLRSTGSASVAADDLGFVATWLLPGQPGLLFVGEEALHGGDGVVFGDGLRCVGTGIARLGVRTPNAEGAAEWGPGLASGGGWSAGDTRYFQVWYRDPGGPCGSGFNLTNGAEVGFLP